MLFERLQSEGRVSVFEALDGDMRTELDKLLAEGKVKLQYFDSDIWGFHHQEHAYITTK